MKLKLLPMLLALLLVAVMVRPGYASVPGTMSYQGVLTDEQGRAVGDGDYSLTFRIYNAASAELWVETHPAVPVSLGIFHVVLGSINPLSALAFDQIYELGIAVGNDPELTPRQPLTTSPYSFRASRVDGIDVDMQGRVGIGTITPEARLQVDSGASNGTARVTSSSPIGTWLFNRNTSTGGLEWAVISSGSGNGEGAGHLLFYQNGTRMVLQSDGDLGVGTITPEARLQVDSGASNVTTRATSSSAIGTWLFNRNTSTGGRDWAVISSGSGNGEGAGHLLFYQNGTRMVLQSDGDLGIGTITPQARLQVDSGASNGTARVTSSSAIGTWLFNRNTSAGGRDWAVISSGSGNGEGAGHLLFYQNGTRMILQNNGLLRVLGGLSVTGAKNFVIDHPQDPANKSLQHNAVEGPGYYTFYHGNVTLDSNGEAWVQLPDYFEALNGEVSYNLTPVGGYAAVYVAQEVEGNRFRVAGGTPELKVSWQVTANRHDPYATDHPYEAEVEKDENEKGTFYYPEGYGQSADVEFGAAANAELVSAMEGGQ